jgi:hypothetical protein
MVTVHNSGSCYCCITRVKAVNCRGEVVFLFIARAMDNYSEIEIRSLWMHLGMLLLSWMAFPLVGIDSKV